MNVPPFVKDFAIETSGTNDKPSDRRLGGGLEPGRADHWTIPTLVGSAIGASTLAFVGAGAGAVGRAIRSRFSAVESR